MAKGPVLFDLEEDAATRPSVSDAPPVPDVGAPAPQGQAMQIAARLAARKPSKLLRLFWWLLTTLIGALVSIAAWNFVMGLLASYPLLGMVMTVLIGAVLLVLVLLCLRELAAFSRLARLDGLHHDVGEALAQNDLKSARAVTDRLVGLYQGREDTRWGRDRLAELRGDQLDAQALLALTEAELLGPLDIAASREVEAAARQVATVTALVPLALADVVAAMTSNLRMIRRVAEVYGGRSGFFGSWRLTRVVLSHLVATGAVAVGDDMLEPILGGTMLAKLSRRFGEGLVNGALTARVGVAAMEVCRPMPFSAARRPKVRSIIKRALSGLFSKTS
ncbi:MAG: TIGR01620 family protein [Sulfitobacter litoralis]|uniref:Membrane protein n=1 Tax=Sulfitobacter litoralis TaxID=335975 RepID=A0ABY0SHS4_9RHOB|nr:TIGR01620 family protein [Sulfitobacter litoralis]MBQ0800413.1 TIGR01620 family protein [Sulfitobacter litoralis]SDP25951.1 putative membrane protein [Sulfitobacter litoralis]